MVSIINARALSRDPLWRKGQHTRLDESLHPQTCRFHENKKKKLMRGFSRYSGK